jgi:hypothetical protein
MQTVGQVGEYKRVLTFTSDKKVEENLAVYNTLTNKILLPKKISLIPDVLSYIEPESGKKVEDERRT